MKRSGKTRNVVIRYEGSCRQKSGDYHLFDKVRSAKSALALAARNGINVADAEVYIPELWSDHEIDDHPYIVVACQDAFFTDTRQPCRCLFDH